MATHDDKPTGPDLAAGISAASLADGAAVHGHVGEEAGRPRPGRRRFPRDQRQVQPLRRPARQGRWSRRHHPLPLAPCLLQPPDRRGAPRPGLRPGRGLAGRARTATGLRPRKAAQAARPPRPRPATPGISSSSAAAPPASPRPSACAAKASRASSPCLGRRRPPGGPAEPLQGLSRRQGPRSPGVPETRRLLRAARHRLELGTTATALDAAARRLELADGRSLGFDRLLLATGAEPVRLDIPGADKPHVFTLRALADARAIIAAAAEAKVAVVIGASFIGLEAAASLTQRGLAVHVVAPDARPLETTLGPELGDLVRARHEAHGVTFHLGRRPAAIEDRAVVLDDGTRLAADLVVTGVGVRPRTALAEAAGLTTDNGVLVDARLEPAPPGIFAAGDIARFPYPLAGGGAVRIEHWVVAARQGQLAARNMLGAGLRYDHAPFFWSRHFDLAIDYVGHAGAWDATEIDGELASGRALVRYRRAGELTATASIGRGRDSLRAERALEAGAQ